MKDMQLLLVLFLPFRFLQSPHSKARAKAILVWVEPPGTHAMVRGLVRLNHSELM